MPLACPHFLPMGRVQHGWGGGGMAWSPELDPELKGTDKDRPGLSQPASE